MCSLCLNAFCSTLTLSQCFLLNAHSLNAFCSTLALSQCFLLNTHSVSMLSAQRSLSQCFLLNARCVSMLSAQCSLCLNAPSVSMLALSQCSLCLSAFCSTLCLNAFCSRFTLSQCFLLNTGCVSLKTAVLFQQPEDQLSQPVRPKGGGKKKAAPGSTTRSQPSRSGAAAATSHPSHTAGLPAHQLAEISRLLGQYNEDVEASSSAFQLSSLQSDPSSMAQILSFLASLPPPQQ